jgi:nucleolin
MLKNGMNLISKQSSKLNPLNRLLCRSFITLSRYNNFRSLNNNSFPIKMSLSFIQNQNMCSRDNGGSNDQSQNNNREIFVANLPWRVDKNALGDFFSKFGDVEDAKVVIDPEGRSKGFGFVKFFSAEDCERALAEADNLNMAGRPITCRQKTSSPTRSADRSDRNERLGSLRTVSNEKSPPSNTLFVGNLSFNSSEESIREFFEEVATVTKVRLSYNENGRPKSFCHVEFDSVESAEAAMKRDGHELDGRGVRLDFAKNRN